MPWGSEKAQKAATGSDTPRTPDDRKRYRAKIDTPSAIRSEIAKLYRACRTGELSVDHFSKLTNALYVLARLAVETEVEVRLLALESEAKA